MKNSEPSLGNVTLGERPGRDSGAEPAGYGFALDDENSYRLWRERKIATYPRTIGDLRVTVADLAAPSAAERARIADLCQRANMAVYATPTGPSGEGESGQQGAAESDARMRVALRAFGDGFGLKVSEDHRSAGEDGIVAIEVTEAPSKRGFIPYTRKALSWHTDGYYNPPEETIRGMLLHCVRPARSGGVNALFDPEIAYMRLRDRDPALVAALMHPEAMSIPEAVEEDGSVRPVSVGPVFIIDPRTGSLTMRYTARARNVVWRDDEDTRRAVAALADILADESDEFMFRYRLEAGEGLISNNVLHTRTAFENEDDAGRLLYRVRYRQRVAGT